MGWERAQSGWPSVGLLVVTMLGATLWLGRPAEAETVTLEAARDNTLYESLTGALSNGLGSVLFAGRSGFFSDTRRRLVLLFDVAGSPLIPAGARIDAVELRLNVSKQNFVAPTTVFALHRLARDWGEGASQRDPDPLFDSGAGQGALAAPGDATWLHSFFNTVLWTSAGGDFAVTASATATVSALGLQTWSSDQMAADVAAWLASPTSNFGWLLKAQTELTGSTARRFDSREHAIPALRPQLVVTFTAGCPDADGDGVCDLDDNCPVSFNPGQADSGGIGAASEPDGIGDTCQCGDVNDSGTVDGLDVDDFRDALADPQNLPLSLAGRSKCTVIGQVSPCDVLDVSVLRREIDGPELLPRIAQVCAAAVPP